MLMVEEPLVLRSPCQRSYYDNQDMNTTCRHTFAPNQAVCTAAYNRNDTDTVSLTRIGKTSSQCGQTVGSVGNLTKYGEKTRASEKWIHLYHRDVC